MPLSLRLAEEVVNKLVNRSRRERYRLVHLYLFWKDTAYVAAMAAFVFVTLSLASGLLYISELIEEHSRIAKLVGQRATYTIIALHLLLYVTDSLPLLQTIFSIICHIAYLQNFSTHWPVISLSSPSFIASCVMAVVNHFLWFIHFSRLASSVRQPYRYRHSTPDAPGFADIAAFFGICVWLLPLFLFLSLSANDNALPTSSGNALDPSSVPTGAQRSKISLFKSMFSVASMSRILASNKSNGLIAPSSASDLSLPLPSPLTSPLRSPLLSPPPRSPKNAGHVSHPEVDPTSPQQTQLSRHPANVSRTIADDGVTLSFRRNQSSRHGRSVGE